MKKTESCPHTNFVTMEHDNKTIPYIHCVLERFWVGQTFGTVDFGAYEGEKRNFDPLKIRPNIVPIVHKSAFSRGKLLRASIGGF
jgi:hypothetical protein